MIEARGKIKTETAGTEEIKVRIDTKIKSMKQINIQVTAPIPNIPMNMTMTKVPTLIHQTTINVPTKHELTCFK